MIAGVLLGLIFNVVAWNFLLHFFCMPEPPAGSPPPMFLGPMIPTVYFAFVKVLEITGGVLVAIPRTRPLGLLGEVMRQRARQGMSPIAGDNAGGSVSLQATNHEKD